MKNQTTYESEITKSIHLGKRDTPLSALEREALFLSGVVFESGFADKLQSKQYEVIYSRTDAAKDKPVFTFIKKGTSYSIAVRGSTDDSDWDTDFQLGQSDMIFQGIKGKAHIGMFNAAKDIISLIHTKIPTDPNAQILVTGHSLGAGVAGLITLM